MSKTLIALIFFIIGHSAFAETRDFDLKLYVFSDNPEQRRVGAGASFEGFVICKSTNAGEKTVFIQEVESSIQYLPKSHDANSIFMLNAFHFNIMGGAFENSNDRLAGLFGGSIDFFDIVSYSNEFKKIGMGELEVKVGYLYESKNGDLVIVGSAGVGLEAITLYIKKGSKAYKELNQKNPSGLENLGGFLVEFNAKLKVKFKKIITLDQSYGIELSPSDSNLKSMRSYQLKASITPFKSISDSSILKSIYVGIDHRQDRINLKGHQIKTKYIGASAGLQF